MRKAQWLVVVFVLGLAATLLGQPIPADAGRPFGTPITIRNEEPVERDPVVAYNSQRQEYLVVFWNDRPGNDDIRAERVSKSGQLLGGSWIAAGEFYDRCHPDAVYNPDTNQYLVVWQHYYQAAGGYAIHGRLLSATGQPLGSSDLIIQGLSVSQPDDPVVAYASTAKKYLVSMPASWARCSTAMALCPAARFTFPRTLADTTAPRRTWPTTATETRSWSSGHSGMAALIVSMVDW
jgi:hypothetical protein